jgi:pimeloyl-ACP methyl ester carboxylesterase
VLFLHGYPTSGRLWDPVVEELAARFTCIAVDLPGLGGSPPLPGPPDAVSMAQEVEALRAELSLPTWSVVGHDAGAVVAVHYAARHPERVSRLALLSPPLFPELRPPWIFRLLRKPGIGDLVAPLALLALRNGGLRSMFDRPTPALDDLLEDFRRPFRGRSGVRRLLWLARWGEPDVVLAWTAALLPLLAAPTLVLHGRRDRTVPPGFAERAVTVIPGARACYLDGGHFLPLDSPEALCGELEPFLAAMEGTGKEARLA